jgi:hypothetical protein
MIFPNTDINEESLNEAINETYLITENDLMFEGWINEESDNYEYRNR